MRVFGARYVLSVLVLVLVAAVVVVSPRVALADGPVPECSYVVSADGVSLSWTAVAGVDKYVAERSVDGGPW